LFLSEGQQDSLQYKLGTGPLSFFIRRLLVRYHRNYPSTCSAKCIDSDMNKLARRAIKYLILSGLILAPPSTWAQTEGEASQGKAFAKAAWTQCHAVGKKQLRSPYRYAPRFRSVENTPSMTATTLHVSFETPHSSMPNLILRSATRKMSAPKSSA
jgi:hypothetical protein